MGTIIRYNSVLEDMTFYIIPLTDQKQKSESGGTYNVPPLFLNYIPIYSKILLTNLYKNDIISKLSINHALLAQLDRVLDYESRGQGFESLTARQ